MANAYGIDLGNVLETKDRISMNKLKKKKFEREIKKDEAGEANIYNKLKAENPNMSEEELRSNALNPDEFKYERKRKDKIEDSNRSHKNALSRISYSSKKQKEVADYKAGLKKTIAKQEADRRFKIIKAQNPNMADDLAQAWAADQTKDFTKVVDAIQDAKTVEQVDAITKVVNNDGATLHTISAIKDPAEREKAWNKYRNQKLKSIKDPKQLEEAQEKIPEAFDPNWVGVTIASSATLLKSAQEAKKYLKKTEAEMKADAGTGVGTATYAQQTAKVNAISKKIDTYFKDLDEPDLALDVKDKVVAKWKKGGMKQNEDEIIKAVIKETMKEQESQNKPESKNVLSKIWDSVSGSDEKGTKSTKKEKSRKSFGNSSKPDGTIGTKNGVQYITVDGKWYKK